MTKKLVFQDFGLFVVGLLTVLIFGLHHGAILIGSILICYHLSKMILGVRK